VAMYGGLWCFRSGTNVTTPITGGQDNRSPLSDAFTQRYFTGLFLPRRAPVLEGLPGHQQRIPAWATAYCRISCIMPACTPSARSNR
jgi:hypothetical protein